MHTLSVTKTIGSRYSAIICFEGGVLTRILCFCNVLTFDSGKILIVFVGTMGIRKGKMPSGVNESGKL